MTTETVYEEGVDPDTSSDLITLNNQTAAFTEMPLIVVPSNAEEKRLQDEFLKRVDNLQREYGNITRKGHELAGKLKTIRDSGEFRLAGFESFNDFMKKHFSVGSNMAYRMIKDEEVREVADRALTAGVSGAAVRPLVGLEKGQIDDILTEAKSMSAELQKIKVEKGKTADETVPPPTAEIVKRAKEKVLGTNVDSSQPAPVDPTAAPDTGGEQSYKIAWGKILINREKKRYECYGKVKIGKEWFSVNGLIEFARLEDPNKK